MNIKEELKNYWSESKIHVHRFVLGGGVYGLLVSLLQDATFGQWLTYLGISYLFALPFTISWKKPTE